MDTKKGIFVNILETIYIHVDEEFITAKGERSYGIFTLYQENWRKEDRKNNGNIKSNQCYHLIFSQHIHVW